MIGVIAKKAEEDIVKEFFELFKTPWEFYREGCSYDVILTTEDDIGDLNAKLVIVYGSNEKRFDRENNFKTINRGKNPVLEHKENFFPVYGNLLTFNGTVKSVLRVKETTDAAGIEVKLNDRKILRAGFDLFQEVNFLLSSGQPLEYAYIPTLEVHISLLRDWILDSGLSLMEIPPVPAGYTFMTCLTHDVDFVGIRRHKFDHTMFGFVYRALFGSLAGVIQRRITWNKLMKNWKAVLSLPFVYLGIMKDFMVQFDRYLEIEKGLGSTFFIIPYKNRAGIDVSGRASGRRAARYDITDVELEIKRLVSCGCEMGVHGIDAWQDSEKGREELRRISHVVGESNIGVRMHWLYYYIRTPQILENAGFSYDSTFGYNNTIGYRGGTSQVFRPLGVKSLLELPLHIQDTALFYQPRMGLTETEALELIRELFKKTTKHGGVLTINWHHRSIGPERLWDDFYIALLERLKELNVWFGTAHQVIKWFNKRRAVSFTKVGTTGGEMHIQLSGNKETGMPDMILRIHYPKTMGFKDTLLTDNKKVDITFNGKFDSATSI